MARQFKDFQKVSEDKHSATMRHPNGHEIKIVKKALSKDLLHQLSALPMAKGGEVPGSKSAIDAFRNGFNGQAKPAQPAPQPKPKAYAEGGMSGAPQTSRLLDTLRHEEMFPKEQPTIPTSQMRESSGDPSGMPPLSPQQHQDDLASNALPVPTSPEPAKEAKKVLDPLEQGVKEQEQALRGASKVEAEQSKAKEELLSADAQAQQDEQRTYSNQLNALYGQQAQLIQAVNDQKINPDNYMQSMSSGKKFVTGIGLILGGIGGGLTGQENPVMKHLNMEIDRDIESQKAELGKKQSLLSDNFKQLGDLRQAEQVTKAQREGLLANQMQRAALQAPDQQAKNRLLMEVGKLHEKAADGLHEVAKERAKKELESKLNTNPNADPAELVPLRVPKEHQEAVYKEIERAQDTKRQSKNILRAFDEAVLHQTLARTGGIRTSAEVKDFRQAMQVTFKDLEGTVRQAAMDNTFENLDPAAGDMEHSSEVKRNALVNYLQSKSSAPRAKSYHIDLGNYESTAPTKGEGAKQQAGGIDQKAIEAEKKRRREAKR